MSECSKCKKKFEEISLTWIQKGSKLLLVCEECSKLLKKVTK